MGTGHFPVVRRCDHADGVMPYGGSALAIANSCVVSLEEAAADPKYRSGATSRGKPLARSLPFDWIKFDMGCSVFLGASR